MGRDFYLCNTAKKIDGKVVIVNCHMNYHTKECSKKCKVVSPSSSTATSTAELPYGSDDPLEPTTIVARVHGKDMIGKSV